MKAITRKRYGGPEELHLSEVPDPVPKPGEVIVRLQASSVNAVDYRMMRADPFLVRLACGFFKPKMGRILGCDVAGIVDSVGTDVHEINVGDRVFGESLDDNLGAFAELIRMKESRLVKIPPSMSFEEAATVPLAGVTALQGVRDLGQITKGSRVLVHGAGGGVGTFVVQIAHNLGAEVTAVCGTASVDLVRELGAHRVLDYTRDDFADEDHKYDAILAINGTRRLREYGDKLTPAGRVVTIGGNASQLFENLLLGRFIVRGDKRKAHILTLDKSEKQSDLAHLSEMLMKGTLRTITDKIFQLEDTADAMRYVEQGHVRGKVVIRIAP